MKLQKPMVIRILIFLSILSSCKSDKEQKLNLDYDFKSVSVENEMFFIEKLKIFNIVDKSLYELKLKEGEVGLSKVFLFQNSHQYLQKGSLEAIKQDTSKKYIHIEIHSRDKQKIELFEARFDIDNRGKKAIESIKEPFP